MTHAAGPAIAALGVGLLGLAVAHVVLIVGIARARGIVHALVAAVLPPLAPIWGWEAGARRAAIAWSAALALYALGVVLG